MLAYSLHFNFHFHFVLDLNHILATLITLDTVRRYELLTRAIWLLMMMNVDDMHFVDGLRFVFWLIHVNLVCFVLLGVMLLNLNFILLLAEIEPSAQIMIFELGYFLEESCGVFVHLWILISNLVIGVLLFGIQLFHLLSIIDFLLFVLLNNVVENSKYFKFRKGGILDLDEGMIVLTEGLAIWTKLDVWAH